MIPRIKKSNKYTVTITPKGQYFSLIKSHSWMRDLMRVFYLIRLDLQQQAFGLTFGHLWLILEPALQAGAYYFLLTIVFGLKGSDSTFAFFLVAIIFWRSHALLTTGAPLFLITKGAQYLDQGFGLKIAFMEFAAQESFLFIMRLLVLFLFLTIAGYVPHLTWLYSLFIGFSMFCFSLCLASWLAILGAIFKDIGKFVGHVVWLWWYISPGLYNFNRIPLWAKPIFLLNPFSYIIPAAHSSLLNYEFTFFHFISNLSIIVVSLIFLFWGWRTMKKFSYILARFV